MDVIRSCFYSTNKENKCEEKIFTAKMKHIDAWHNILESQGFTYISVSMSGGWLGYSLSKTQHCYFPPTEVSL